MNLGPSALQRTSALLGNWACLGRRSVAGRAALLARQRCPASRWPVVLGIPTPTVGLLLVPAGTVFRMAFLASLRDALVWPVPVPGVPLGKGGLAVPPANLLPSLRDGFRTPAGLFEASLDRIPKGCGDISRGSRPRFLRPTPPETESQRIHTHPGRGARKTTGHRASRHGLPGTRRSPPRVHWNPLNQHGLIAATLLGYEPKFAIRNPQSEIARVVKPLAGHCTSGCSGETARQPA